MDVFQLRKALVDDYAAYTRSFIKIRDPRIEELVSETLDRERFWPEPLIQLNPAYQPGGGVDELVEQGLLHPRCSEVFRFGKQGDDPRSGTPARLYEHQRRAIELARQGKSYVLTSGTGSGKSLTYIVPIVDHVLRSGSGGGIQAIIVYPMNALANSQHEELGKFLCLGFPEGRQPVRFARYTGQEREEERKAIRENPPDILLTNYVMLELLLTRAEDQDIVRRAQGLSFLVFDELHTYRGRQGADVAMLIRRCREALRCPNALCVGTSATMSTGGTTEEQRDAVAQVAQKLFGVPFSKDQVVHEALRRTTRRLDFSDPAVVEALRRAVSLSEEPPTDPGQMLAHPLASWIEDAFGLRAEEGTGTLVRRAPRRLIGDPVEGEPSAADELAALTGEDPGRCADALRRFLLQGSRLTVPGERFPIFAFRLHQFFTRGDTVWASLEPPDVRHLEIAKTSTKPGEPDKVLFPLRFCRHCGQEYYRVVRRKEGQWHSYAPREDVGTTDEDGEDGYLHLSVEEPFPAENDPDYLDRLPAHFLEEVSPGRRKVKQSLKKQAPRRVFVRPDGTEGPDGLAATFVPRNLHRCLNLGCGATYATSMRSETIKLGTLGVDGRSTATTILALKALAELRGATDLDASARKLLSFTDNRQDASLQAGHFNDFVQVALLRSALWEALSQAGPHGLRHDVLPARVFDSLGLPFEEYAAEPNVHASRRTSVENVLKDVLEYLLYRDLKRGWRITAPNLEETGLLRFDYDGLTGPGSLLENGQIWVEGVPRDGAGGGVLPCPPCLRSADPSARDEVLRTLLELMRRGLAIKLEALDQQRQPELVRRAQSDLLPDSMWYLEDERSMDRSTVLFPRPAKEKEPGLFVSSFSGFGTYLAARLGIPRGATGQQDEIGAAIRFLLEALRHHGIVGRVRGGKDGSDPGYQLIPSSMVWLAGDGTVGAIDRTRLIALETEAPEPNAYFSDLYRRFIGMVRAFRSASGNSAHAIPLEAREHTAQVDGDSRKEREQRFREGSLPLLFCSPTMELGVDIADLNVVNLRNIPPTPANYAQRSGRAGRGGQPAMVYTYCAGRSPHDQFFFGHPTRMVAGSVAPPRVDLLNQDLLKAHVHAIWLELSGLDLGKTLCDVIDADETDPKLALPLKDHVRAALRDDRLRRKAADQARRVLAAIEPELKQTTWYDDQWVDQTLQQLEVSFEAACERWRDLYRAAVRQRDLHFRLSNDRSRSQQEREQSRALRGQAERQLDLLTEPSQIAESDFYVYRYLATEGFLPGYNFPRLPISAYVPQRRRARYSGNDSFVSRPRFLAISEFGPGALVYHEGARYKVHKVNLVRHSNSSEQDRELPTEAMKRCGRCGYAHQVDPAALVNVCERCGEPLDAKSRIDNLVRMRSVVLRLRDRITCDEEERQRLGYRIETAYRFPTLGGKPSHRDAEVQVQDTTILRLSYADSTDLFRINVGWSKRQVGKPVGFQLDVEKGVWVESEKEPKEAIAKGARLRQVVPYVMDTKNALVMRFEPVPSEEALAGLGSALWQAMLQRFQLEPRELAYEPMPSADDRRELLFYEASEGGAGVLRQLVEDPKVVPELARIALELCHFDPTTLADLAANRCGKACYECLLDYGNQRDHAILDRHVIKTHLQRLSLGTALPSGGAGSRSARLQSLLDQCDSQLERQWLELVDKKGLRLPDEAQRYLPTCQTRPDFFYREPATAVYIDGPPHDEASTQAADREVEDRLLDSGYVVVRFHHAADWDAIFAKHPDVFGKPKS
ncbi:MAG: DEAD/DEAH box helicase [Fimbriimonadaceae bacterium]